MEKTWFSKNASPIFVLPSILNIVKCQASPTCLLSVAGDKWRVMGRVRTQLISGDKSYQNTPHICISQPSPAPGKPKYTLLAALKMCEIYRSLQRHTFWNCIPTTLDHITTLHISFHCANISLFCTKHKARGKVPQFCSTILKVTTGWVLGPILYGKVVNP